MSSGGEKYRPFKGREFSKSKWAKGHPVSELTALHNPLCIILSLSLYITVTLSHSASPCPHTLHDPLPLYITVTLMLQFSILTLPFRPLFRS